MLTPKADELVADPFRHGNRKQATDFFERGFAKVFEHLQRGSLSECPITVFYAFKQAETQTSGSRSALCVET